ncbi:MAG: HEAT repeat domain-containing protein, partial [Patescibacteria group bacterium]|nr:HEAT repeat domain-containing protein [Patescibacteria group bacterium]
MPHTIALAVRHVLPSLVLACVFLPMNAEAEPVTPREPGGHSPNASAVARLDPFHAQVGGCILSLESPGVDAATRARAAEALGYLRYAPAADVLTRHLGDSSAAVRREVALSLGWCGGRDALGPLCGALDDTDWTVRQAAWVALTNLTGMEFPFDALAEQTIQDAQAGVWRAWVAGLEPGRVPSDLLILLGDLPDEKEVNHAANRPVEVTSRYVGGGALAQTSDAKSITDGSLKTVWMTKSVAFPQSCTIDLGEDRSVGCVIIHEHGPFAMTEFSVDVREDGGEFIEVAHVKQATEGARVVGFVPRPARFVRVTSRASRNPTYPTAILQVEVRPRRPPEESPERELEIERAVRAMGALGGEGAVGHVIRAIHPWCHREDETRLAAKRRVQAGIRALGRLADAEAIETLIAFLQNGQWARYAADALGDVGGEDAAAALLAAYPACARGLDQTESPARIHPTDSAGFDARDRIPATAYAIAMSLCRIRFDRGDSLVKLREIGPLLLANIPNDADALMVYEEEPHQKITAWLLDRAGLRQAAVDAAFEALGQDRRVPDVAEKEVLRQLSLGMLNTEFPAHADSPPYAGSFLAALCREKSDVPLLLNLLEHPNRWVRINATKALIFMDAKEAIGPLAKKLAESPPEADYGFFAGRLHDTPQVGQDEFNDPTPRDREAYIMALGTLGAAEHVPMLVEIVFDERNALECRYAAARSLDMLGTPSAVDALRRAEVEHDFHTVRAVAREALWKRGIAPTVDLKEPAIRPPQTALSQTALSRAALSQTAPPQVVTGPAARFVFVKGDHNPYNTFRTDNWRQTHNTTDSGPVCRPGDNLWILDMSGGRPIVTPLTTFADGYVADATVSYDGDRVLFARREQDDPWWHVCEIQVDGGGLRQLTHGPYHHVSPAYLPDGRIVFSTTRLGTRDEYHGYPCTGLAVMQADGSDIEFIGFNLGRDADTVVGPYGNLLFARLEIFYARLKVEWNLLSVFPDGTRATTLYGPERRELWRGIHGGYLDWGTTGLRHRGLRLSQPQPFGPASYILNTPAGPIITEGRFSERILREDQQWVITTPYPLDGNLLMVAAAPKPEVITRGGRPTDTVDLGLYTLDASTGELSLVYNDPELADFGARPLHPRPIPPVIPESESVRRRSFTGVLYCGSAFTTQIEDVRQRGKLVRVIEGLPQVARHQTHTNHGLPWKNHGGATGRVLGTVPLAADGSFAVETPADRFVHLQVLDSDRYVVGNQLLWMYVRPGESKGCVGCHEQPDTASESDREFPLALLNRPVATLPTGDDQFRYR